ncbi:MAG TPA: polysaccharide deacetylase family protein [Gaiellales bacterium]|nr:polysaccharide deacetylase family protein [Gaiellales bacterium]
MTGPRLELDVPEGFAAEARWTLETLLGACAAPTAEAVRYGASGGLDVSERAWELFAAGEAFAPALGDDGLLDFGDGARDLVASAFWHLSRYEERGGARDEHGRFPASAALADPERPAVDSLLRAFRGHVGDRGATPFTVALTHDIDIPWRWSRPQALRGAAARARVAARERRKRDVAAEAAGLAAAPIRKLTRTDPNWSYERIAAIERGHGGRSTYFVMAGHNHAADGPDPAAYDRLRPAIVAQIAAQGDEVGLHPSYLTSERPQLLAVERERLEALTGARVPGVRFHYLRHDTHATLPQLDGLGFAYDSSQGYGDAIGLRAGFSFPYRPFHLAERRPLDLVELPMAVMDATLAEQRYLGLEPRAGLERTLRLLERVAGIGGTVAILWHTDRFSREYARGWDRVYADVLEWVADRGGRLVTAADAVAAG